MRVSQCWLTVNSDSSLPHQSPPQSLVVRHSIVVKTKNESSLCVCVLRVSLLSKYQTLSSPSIQTSCITSHTLITP